MDFSRPAVMGIVNLTPDSFYPASRSLTVDGEALARRVEQMVADGATIIDVGAVSTRPGATDVAASEEMRRLDWGLPIVVASAGGCSISVDTFRADVARHVVERYGVDIINDVSGGADADMFSTVARLGVAYVLTSCSTVGAADAYDVVRTDLVQGVGRLRQHGVRDVIADPGYGFGKTLAQNYAVFARQGELVADVGCPLLVGISRKSMIYRLLATDPDHSLAGTTALHAIAFMQGASIVRVHDVREAVDAMRVACAVASAR